MCFVYSTLNDTFHDKTLQGFTNVSQQIWFLLNIAERGYLIFRLDNQFINQKCTFAYVLRLDWQHECCREDD